VELYLYFPYVIKVWKGKNSLFIQIICTKIEKHFDVDVDWFAVRVTLMHLGLKLQALCAPLLVPSFNSRGAPHHVGVKDLC
jgi:hypothetical protein